MTSEKRTELINFFKTLLLRKELIMALPPSYDSDHYPIDSEYTYAVFSLNTGHLYIDVVHRGGTWNVCLSAGGLGFQCRDGNIIHRVYTEYFNSDVRRADGTYRELVGQPLSTVPRLARSLNFFDLASSSLYSPQPSSPPTPQPEMYDEYAPS